MQSNIIFDQTLFDPASISDDIHAFNDHLMKLSSSGPKWFEVGAAKYRQLRVEGKTQFPKPTYLPSASSFEIPSRDEGRNIPCRILRPQNGATPKGVFMHIHGGGWVLSDEKSLDPTLQWLADTTGVLAISVGYRLAPENKFPAGPNDCYDAVEWLIRNADSEFGAPLSFIGGESAGGHLSMLTALHVLQHEDPKINSFRLKGLILHYGVFDLLFSPSAMLFQKPKTLVLDKEIMLKFADAFVPGMTMEERQDPSVSPLYADLQKLRGRLPPALFTCGTEDMLLDDTIFMSGRYAMAGAETIVKIVPGGCHGYTYYPRDTKGTTSAQGLDAAAEFIKEKIV